jgi:hypothetical protein
VDRAFGERKVLSAEFGGSDGTAAITRAVGEAPEAATMAKFRIAAAGAGYFSQFQYLGWRT